MTIRYSCVDAFSGAGGLALGLSNAGLSVVLSFDNDEHAIATQKLNTKYFRHKILKEDINHLIGGKVLPFLGMKKGELFLLAGGPPCQGFSIQRIGKDSDSRNDLVLRYGEFLAELMPKFFLMENVPGLLGKRGKPYFDRITKKAKALGYVTYHHILDAEDYSVPQRRHRVVLVGIREDLHHGPFSFPKPTTPAGHRITVKEAIAHFPTPPDDGSEHPNIPNHRKDKLSTINLKRIMSLKQGEGRAQLPRHLLANCHLKSSPNEIGHRNVYGRMSWNAVAPTITAKFDSFTRGQFGHPIQNRSITLREGAVLQTFPDDFVFVGTKVEVARQIGNAVPVRLAEALGRGIINYYAAKRKR